MASDGAMAYGIIAVLVVYYSASFGLSYAPRYHRHRVYIAFFVLAMLTVIVEMLHNLGSTSAVTQTVMMWGVIGPVYDLAQSDWPSSGSLVLITSQLIFVLSVVDVYQWIAAAIMVLTAVIVAAARWTKAPPGYTHLPESVVDSM